MIPGDREHKLDISELMGLPSFRRFLWRAIQQARILETATNGADARNLDFFEGRRSLGFDLLSDVEAAMAVPHPQALWTILQVLRVEAQPNTSQRNATNDPPPNQASDDDDRPSRV
jgi:hypothetical protein